MTEVKKALSKEDCVLEVVELNKRIFTLANYATDYQCHCLLFEEKQKEKKNFVNCHYCLQEYHPHCQANPMFCNSCYLRFCLMDLTEEIKDPFSENKEASVYFFGYIQTSVHSPPEDS